MKRYIFLLLLLSLIPLFDLFHPGLPITHDGQDHVARIANFYLNLSQGNIIPRWAPNLNWGYGHPILMFLYPLPSYAASFFHFLGFSLVDSVKIIFGLAFFLSGIFMYLWLREFLDEYSGLLGALLYMFAPYRFVDLYVRGALGEHVAFLFLPLIFYFMFRLSKKGKNHAFNLVGVSISIAGLLLSHNAISLMFLPLIILYAFFLLHLSNFDKGLIRRFIFSLTFGFGLSSFFLLPAFFEGKYTLRDIVTAKDYATRFTDFSKFLYGQWNYGISGQFSVQVGIIHWAAVIASIPLGIILFRKNKLILFSVLIFFLTIFLMVPESKFVWDKITILQKFQFPWRFLSMSAFISSVLGGVIMSQIKGYRKLLLVIFAILILFASKDMWHAKSYLIKSENFFTGIYNGTTDTGESAPIWSVRFMEKRPPSHIQIISGKGVIKEIFRDSTKHEYEISANGEARIRENTLYFPGWEVLVDGKKTSIEFQDPSNRGLMTFFVPDRTHKVDVLFGETNFRLFSDIISAISILGLITIVWQNKHFRLS